MNKQPRTNIHSGPQFPQVYTEGSEKILSLTVTTNYSFHVYIARYKVYYNLENIQQMLKFGNSKVKDEDRALRIVTTQLKIQTKL